MYIYSMNLSKKYWALAHLSVQEAAQQGRDHASPEARGTDAAQLTEAVNYWGAVKELNSSHYIWETLFVLYIYIHTPLW